MKNSVTLIFVILLTVLISTSVFPQKPEIQGKALQDSSVGFKDGTFEGMSRAKYIYEPFWGSVRISLTNGRFTEINFVIRDSNLHETFDANYEKHFTGNAEYIQQSRNDWKGVQSYPEKLSEKQDINKVDAVSGATWSYNIFKASVIEALKKAK
jgi:major membrane immunogen (membrane-anchored lipoprotein)